MGKLSDLVLASVVGMGLVPACSGRPASTPEGNVTFKNGTRLTAVHYEIEGAPDYFVGWYDTQLGFDCAFVADDLPDHGVCFPSQTWQSSFANDAFRFADAACSAPVVGSYFPGESRYFVRWNSEAVDACGSPSARLYRVGDVAASGTTLYLKDDSGACRPATPTEPSDYPELRVLGAELPFDALVSGSYRHDGASGRVVPLTVAGSDGSFQGAMGTDGGGVIAWDRERQERVTASPAPDGRWNPTVSYSAFFFEDAACTTRVAVGTACESGGKEGSVVSYEYDTCGRRKPPSYFELGPSLGALASIYYAPDGSTCVQGELPPTDLSYLAFSVGNPIPIASFAEAVGVRTGSGQLQVVQVASPGGPAMGALGLFDSVLGRACAPSVAGDGATRCLPDAFVPPPLGFFADGACSIPLVFSAPPAVPCAPAETLVSATTPDDQTGNPRRHIYPLGGPYVGMIYWQQLPGDCMAIGDNINGGWGDVFTVGPEIPAAAFAPVNLVRPN